MFRRLPTSGVLAPATGGQNNQRQKILRFTGTISSPGLAGQMNQGSKRKEPGAPGPTGNTLGPKAVREHGPARPGMPAFLGSSHT